MFHHQSFASWARAVATAVRHVTALPYSLFNPGGDPQYLLPVLECRVAGYRPGGERKQRCGCGVWVNAGGAGVGAASTEKKKGSSREQLLRELPGNCQLVIIKQFSNDDQLLDERYERVRVLSQRKCSRS